MSAPARGTGTAAAISGLAAGLEALGCRVTVVRPESSRGGGHSRLPGRLRFNLGLRRFDPSPYDAVVGFDFDGVFLPRPGPGTARRHASGDGAAGPHPTGLRLAGGVPYAVSLKGVAADELGFERGLPRLTFRLLAALEGRNVRRASRVLVTSEYCRRVAVAAYGLDPARVVVVPEGIDLALWPARLDVAGGAERSREAGRPPVVLSVARQYRRKDTRTLLEAFARLRESHPEARLRIVGGGPELPRLRARARELGLGERATLLGEVPDGGAVRREYLAADLFCLPSLQEGFGIAFLEAMAAGLPIVAARAAAVPEVAPDGEVGLLVPPRDAEALAEALARLLDDADLRRRFGQAGRRRVERYDWRTVAGEFLRALDLA
ncbi:MAG TPA: glycosyltransferase family 4 protein [Thermoanaerobaculia bacterium]|nr:glycosyltransferase family 4 protein [Thermoanaerobaculia bacterium]